MEFNKDFNKHSAKKKTIFSEVNIETPRLILREFKPSDSKRLLEISNSKGFFYYCFDGSQEKVDAFMKKASDSRNDAYKGKERKYIILAIIRKDTQEFIGVTSLENFHFVKDHNHELNFFVDPKHQGKGFGTEAISNMGHYGFSHMGIKGFNVTIHPKNLASQAVAKSQGFKQVDSTIINTSRGKEPRSVFIINKRNFYKLHAANDNRAFLNKKVSIKKSHKKNGIRK